MKVGIIGAGKMGCALALALKQKGATLSGVYSRNEASAWFLTDRLGEPFENNLARTVGDSEVLLVTVPDSAIEEMAREISTKVGHLDLCWKTFLHCSGALSSDALESLRLQGGYTGSLHPIQTFADRENGWKGLEGIYFGFEGCTEAKEHAGKIVEMLGGHMLVVEKKDKPLYHAAACILSNYTVTLSYLAGNLLDSIGIGRDTGVKAFMPLLEKTVKNIGELGSAGALTGPISRGDSRVVEGHIKAMEEQNPGMGQVYRLLGRMTAELALKKGSIGPLDMEKLYKVLKDNGE